jgi:hypothetical protein
MQWRTSSSLAGQPTPELLMHSRLLCLDIIHTGAFADHSTRHTMIHLQIILYPAMHITYIYVECTMTLLDRIFLQEMQRLQHEIGISRKAVTNSVHNHLISMDRRCLIN